MAVNKLGDVDVLETMDIFDRGKARNTPYATAGGAEEIAYGDQLESNIESAGKRSVPKIQSLEA